MKFLTILRGELTKMFRQRGTYAGYIMLGIFIGLFVWGAWAEGPDQADLDRQFGDEFAVGGKMISGPSIPYLLMEIPVAIDIFIPLLISMIAGGIIAGELQRGTLRTMLTRPVHRHAVALGKIAAAMIHAASLVVFLGGFSLLLGCIVFGRGDIITVEGGFRVFAGWHGLARLGIAYGAVVLTMWSVAAIAVFCSTIFEHPLTASGVTVGFLILSAALMAIPYFKWLKPYLLTTHFHGFRAVFEKAINWQDIGHHLSYVAAYAAVAVAGTLLVFCRKDVTC